MSSYRDLQAERLKNVRDKGKTLTLILNVLSNAFTYDERSAVPTLSNVQRAYRAPGMYVPGTWYLLCIAPCVALSGHSPYPSCSDCFVWSPLLLVVVNSSLPRIYFTRLPLKKPKGFIDSIPRLGGRHRGKPRMVIPGYLVPWYHFVP